MTSRAIPALARFKPDHSGSIAAWFGLATLPLTVFAGSAVDYGRATSAKAALQDATDRAALRAAASPAASTADRAAIAQAFLPAPASSTLPTGSVTINGRIVTITATRTIRTTMLGVVGLSGIPVSARASAERIYQGPPICIMALNPTASGSITIMGNSNLAAPGCAVYSDSSSGSAITAGGSAIAQAAGFCAVGGVSASGSTLTPTAETGCSRLDDPFKNVSAPDASGTVYNNVTVQPGTQQTLSPGTYRNGLSIKGSATLNPGLYIINGALNISSQANVTGAGVTFYLTGAQAGFTINGGGTIDLTPMTSGAYTGLLIVQDRTANAGNDNKLNGDSNTKLNGAIYTPTQTLTLVGSSGFGASSTSMPIVVDQIKMTGNTTAKVDATAAIVAPIPLSQGGARLTN